MDRSIQVYADWAGLRGAQFMGTLHTALTRGIETFYFEYATEWLNGANTQMLDPELGLYSGAQFTRSDRRNFGLFLGHF